MYSLRELFHSVKDAIWAREIDRHSRLVRLLIYLVRLFHGIIGKLTDGQITLWAMALAYTTILSLVPLLAVSFSVLKAFGAHLQLEPILMETLQPLGEQGVKVAASILNFVENIKVGVLGSVGIAGLFYTVISLLHTVEQAFNAIWHVPSTRRPARRFSDYLSVILVGPVLIFAALGLTASVKGSAFVQSLAAVEPVGSLILGIGRLTPYLLICGAFAFLYAFITNTRVSMSAALAGGVFAGVLWYATGMIFTAFVAGSSSYSGVYSGFAGAALFIIWLQIGWMVTLLGSQVAFYWQYPHLLNLADQGELLPGRRREKLALEIMTLIGQAHYYNQPPWTMEAMESRYRGISSATLTSVVESLLKRKLIVASRDNPPFYLPARDIGTIDIAAVMAVVEGENISGPFLPAVGETMRQIDSALGQAMQGTTVKDLVVAGELHSGLSKTKAAGK